MSSLSPTFEPCLLGMVCNWCCYGGADLCGVSRFQYPPHIRLIRVMCSARVDLLHVLRALANGQDGVFIGGCHLCDCHYVTNGNFNAFAMVQVGKRILKYLGIVPERLRIEWVSAGEGIRFAHLMSEFSAEVTELGPLGKVEGLSASDLAARLEAARRLVPYVKLVLTQKLQVVERTPEAYQRFFGGTELERLFGEALAGKLDTSRILLLLREQPLSTAEIAERSGLAASAVSAHLTRASSQGLVRYDLKRRRYALVRCE